MFDNVAKLAKLHLGENDKVILEQLGEAARYIEVLNELDIGKTAPTFQVNGKENCLREDTIEPSLDRDTALSQAKKSYHGFFVTKPEINK